VEFYNVIKGEETIEFHKDEEDSAVANQNELVCITSINNSLLLSSFSSSLGHGACPIYCWKKSSDERSSVLPVLLLKNTFKKERLVSSRQMQAAWRLFAPYFLAKVPKAESMLI
jgi:hypothetical protein